MDKRKIPLPQAQLWIGCHEELRDKVENSLQKELCEHDGCNVCTTCRLIRENKHHAIVWLYPEKRYTLESLSVIAQSMSFELDQGEKFFFIVQKADCLTTACSNSLLKSIEEPPPGYHFIFCAERKDLILDTIRSRCIIKVFQTDSSEHSQEKLLSFFKTGHPKDPLSFMQELKKSNPHEHQSQEMVNILLDYWMNEAKKKALAKDDKSYQKAIEVVAVLQEALLNPPMPGSGQIFWKNLFLRV